MGGGAWPFLVGGAICLVRSEEHTSELQSQEIISYAVFCLKKTAKAFAKDVFINQERKLGARRRSDTVLVSTINDADQGCTSVNSFKFQPCDHTPPGTQKL